MKKRHLLGDAVTVIITLTICLIFAVSIYNSNENTEMIDITVNGKLYGRYSILDDTEINVENTGVTVCISDKEAFIIQSDCPDKICYNSSISLSDSSLKTIICMPNKVCVSAVNKTTNSEVDAVAG